MTAGDSDRIIEILQWVVDRDDTGLRLDHFLRDQDVGTTRSHLKQYIDGGYVKIDDRVEHRPAKKLKSGQRIELRVPAPEPLSAEPENIPLDIRYEDEGLLVVNKPQNLVVHPAPGHPRGTLVNGILYGRTAKGGDPLRPGIVHRLDKDTSGLMVVAKREDVHSHLALQFHEHSVDRRYAVLVSGNPPERGEWITLHGRKAGDRRCFSSKVTKGKTAKSTFVTDSVFNGAALIKVTLYTGRTHQVRVHCKDHGYPVLGDPWYGPKNLSPFLKTVHGALPGQALHAELLGFDHPLTGQRLSFESPPPESFQNALQMLQEHRK